MPTLERLTIDSTVLHDVLRTDRPRHHRALQLFALFERGEADLMIAAQGNRFDIRDGDLAEGLRKLIEKGLREAPQIAWLSEETYPAPDFLPGAVDQGFDNAWAAVVQTWDSSRHGTGPAGAQDRWQVKTHLLEQRDVFVTNDKALLNTCRRLHAEHHLRLVAMTLDDYMDGRGRPNVDG